MENNLLKLIEQFGNLSFEAGRYFYNGKLNESDEYIKEREILMKIIKAEIKKQTKEPSDE